MRRVGKKGIVYSQAVAAQIRTTWDNVEDTAAIGATDLDLTSGTLGDSSGVGDGTNRSLYVCRGIHNPNSTAVTVYYQADVAGSTSHNFHIYVPAGGTIWPWVVIKVIKGTGTGTTAAVLTLLYQDKQVWDSVDSRNIGVDE